MGQIKSFAIYSRKSRFTGKGESIENQIELCRQYLERQYGSEAAATARVFEDEGFSGKTLDRPQFKQMMQAAEAGEISAIVVYRLDRISRSIGDFAALMDHLTRLEIAFLSIREQFDTASPMGRAMMYIASVFSQLERETIAERIRDNLHELAKSGRWLGGTSPTGFSSAEAITVSVDGKRRHACHLKPNPAEMAAVRRIYALFLTDGSLANTVECLQTEGFRTRRGGAFSRFAVRAILENPVYMTADADAYQYLRAQGCELSAPAESFDGLHGVMPYNRTLQRPGKTHIHRPMPEWIVAVGAHPGTVSGAQWVRVQSLLARNRTGARTPTCHTALLSGVLYCACGARMRVKLGDKTAEDGARQFRYICTAREKSGGTSCQCASACGNALDAAIFAELIRLPEDAAEWERQLHTLERQYAARADSLSKSVRLRAAEKEIQTLVQTLTQAEGSVSVPYILSRIETLHRECDILRAHMREESVETVLPCAGFAEMMETATVAEKRSAVRALVKQIVWDGETAHVLLNGG